MTPHLHRAVLPLVAVAASLPVILTGCVHVKTDPIEVKTIHIQHDVTIGVDKALEDFFAFQERSATQPTTTTTNPATTQPAAAPAPAAAAMPPADTAGDVK
jgi:hypothetical protein